MYGISLSIAAKKGIFNSERDCVESVHYSGESYYHRNTVFDFMNMDVLSVICPCC